MKSPTNIRLSLLAGLMSFIALALIVRLYVVQVMQGSSYAHDASSQYIENKNDEVRGSIFFRGKDNALIAAASMQTGYRVAIEPAKIEDPDGTLRRLASVIKLDAERYRKAVQRVNDPYEEVAFQLDKTQADAISALKLSGVTIVEDQWRVYPAHALAGETVGYVGFLDKKKTGLYGLEKQWQETLVEDETQKYRNPFAQLFSNVQDTVQGNIQEGDIATSIEPAVQKKVQDELEKILADYKPKRAGAIVMDPHTGEIIAMALAPTFDPNEYNKVGDHALFTNPLVEGRYEMGSIMKPLTVAAALDAGVITPQTKYTDTGCVELSGKKVCNFDGKPRGKVDMQEVLSQSLNVGISFIVGKLGQPKMRSYFDKYFDTKTGIDVPNEVNNDIHALEGNADVDFASAGFGQGIAVSPVSMIRALSALANEGTPVSPHVVTQVLYPSGAVSSVPHPILEPVISTTSARTITDMLVTVVDKALLHGEVRNDRYTMAAKTGTAQIAASDGSGYSKDRFMHTFFGYFPAYQPRFVVFMYALEPKGVEFASASLAKPFKSISDYLIDYYAIPPDR